MLVLAGFIFYPSKEKTAGEDMSGRSTWFWDTVEIIENKEEIIGFFKTRGVDDVYLQVNPSVGTEHYHQFIEMAGAENIDVYALDGAPSWVTVKGHTSFLDFYDWLEAYQLEANESQRFSGVHLDVEPYLLSGWTTAYGKINYTEERMIIHKERRNEYVKNSLGCRGDRPGRFPSGRYTPKESRIHKGDFLCEKG